MGKIKDLIREYLLVTIQTKHNMRKRIYQLEAELKEANENLRDAITQKDKYKEINKRIRRKMLIIHYAICSIEMSRNLRPCANCF